MATRNDRPSGIESDDITHEDDGTLVFNLHGQTLAYRGVDSDTVDAFRNASSRGGFFNARIRNSFDFEGYR